MKKLGLSFFGSFEIIWIPFFDDSFFLTLLLEEKGFTAVWNIQWKQDVVFLEFIIAETANF